MIYRYLMFVPFICWCINLVGSVTFISAMWKLMNLIDTWDDAKYYRSHLRIIRVIFEWMFLCMEVLSRFDKETRGLHENRWIFPCLGASSVYALHLPEHTLILTTRLLSDNANRWRSVSAPRIAPRRQASVLLNSISTVARPLFQIQQWHLRFVFTFRRSSFAMHENTANGRDASAKRSRFTHRDRSRKGNGNDKGHLHGYYAPGLINTTKTGYYWK